MENQLVQMAFLRGEGLVDVKANRLMVTVLAAILAVSAFITFYAFISPKNAPTYLINDPLDPLPDAIESLFPKSVRLTDPFELGHKLAGLKGQAIVFSSQAQNLVESRTGYTFTPLYSASVVIAVNKYGNSQAKIDGWHSMLESEAKMFMPHNATEGGRLAAMAMAKGLGGAGEDYSTALTALANLNKEGRLNGPYEYAFEETDYMYDLARLALYDAAVMWDYQAVTLVRQFDHWEVVEPREGMFTVNCGLLSRNTGLTETATKTKDFLESAEGAEMLHQLGFSPVTQESVSPIPNWSGFTYNPSFRRTVLGIKLRAPASLLERLVLQTVVFVLFIFGAERIVSRIRGRPQRLASLFGVIMSAFWLLIGITKALSLNPHLARYLWFATYIPRHFWPLAWYAMCYANRHDRLPDRAFWGPTLSIASLFTILVFTNDWHRQVFVYTTSDPAVWKNYYTHAWGYYVSVAWSLSILASGLFHVIRNENTHRRRKQFIYCGLFFAALAFYQVTYLLGNQYVMDLDIPTTIAVFFLLFNWAARQERFLGATLLDLPIFSYSGYGLAVYNHDSQPVFVNDTIRVLNAIDSRVPGQLFSKPDITQWSFGGKHFRSHTLTMDAWQGVVLEDISQLVGLRRSLQESQRKLKALSLLLLSEAEQSAIRTSRAVRRNFSRQLEELFHGSLTRLSAYLEALTDIEPADYRRLSRARFLVSLCQLRLRFVLQAQEIGVPLPVQLLTDYAAGLIKVGERFGLDAIFIPEVVAATCQEPLTILLDAVDFAVMYALDQLGASLICRMKLTETRTVFEATISWDGAEADTANANRLETLMSDVHKANGQCEILQGDDSFAIRIFFACREVR